MSIVLLSGDLMTQSRVEAAAQRCRVSLRSASSAASLLANWVESPTAIVLLDLTLPMGDIASIVGQLKSLPGARPAIIAFGPHVHESLLAAANEAGCDEVLSRGQFFSQIDAIVARAVAPQP